MSESTAPAGAVPRVDERLQRGLWLMLIAAVLLFSGLGSYPLLDRDESRYGQIPREMLERGDWIVPRLYGQVYTDKPPLQYWQVMLAFEIFGRNEFAARLPAALGALALLAGVYWLASGFHGPRTGFLCGFVLLTMLLFFGLGRYLVLDGILSTYTLLAAFVTFANLPRPPEGTAELAPGDSPDVRANASSRVGEPALLGQRTLARGVAAWVLLGLAVLVKGPVAQVLFGMPFILFRIWEHGLRWLWSPRLWWRLMRDVHLPVGLPVMLCVAAPWFAVMEARQPGFLHTFFVEQNLQRYTSNAYSRAQPFYFFLMIAVAGLFPWTTFVPGAVVRLVRAGAWRRLPITRPLPVFGLVVGLFPVLFFSTSHSKLIPYIAPCFPGFGLLLGWYFGDLIGDPTARPPRFAARVLGSAAVAVGMAPWLYSWLVAQQKLEPHVPLSPLALILFSVPMLALGLFLVLTGHRARTAAIVAATGAAMVAFLGAATVDGLTERAGLGFSHAALMEEIATAEPGDTRPIFVYREADEHASFYFYCEDWAELRSERDPTALRAQLQACGQARMLLHRRDLTKLREAIGPAFEVVTLREVGNSFEWGVTYLGEPKAPPAGLPGTVPAT